MLRLNGLSRIGGLDGRVLFMDRLLVRLYCLGIIILSRLGNRLYRIRIGRVFMILIRVVVFCLVGIVILLMFVIGHVNGLLFLVFVLIEIGLFVRLFGLVRILFCWLKMLLLLIVKVSLRILRLLMLSDVGKLRRSLLL